ncbi:uncharacterized protein LOC114529005 [Dendronephthya gigantea]|uniref:uncharacterized protein LOC114529005 n=1 Tax=Dendronephthya gigantea TaxID=151771 RepID=UPI00106A08D2|nr:uncharacterized protein LOC114529005 [Dendronephthya gigantea]
MTEYSESSTENSQNSLPELGAWQISEEFNLISKHKLVVEQRTRDKESQSPQDEETSPGDTGVWPALFGDSTSIFNANKNEIDTEKEQPMCGLFEKAERKHFSQRRILAGLSPSEVKASRDIFEGDDAEDIFA